MQLGEGQAPLPEVVSTIRRLKSSIIEVQPTLIRDQCGSGSGTCWLVSTISSLEIILHKKLSVEVPLSAEFLYLSSLRERAFEMIFRQEPVRLAGGYLWKAAAVIYQYGAIPESIWQPRVSLLANSEVIRAGLWEIVDSFLAEAGVLGRRDEVERKALQRKARKQVDDYLFSYSGSIPELFDWNGKSYSLLSFVRSFSRAKLTADTVSLVRPPDPPRPAVESVYRPLSLYTIYLPDGDRWNLVPYTASASPEQILGLIKESIDKGEPLIFSFSYRYIRILRDIEPGAMEIGPEHKGGEDDRHATVIVGYGLNSDGKIGLLKMQDTRGAWVSGYYYMTAEVFSRVGLHVGKLLLY